MRESGRAKGKVAGRNGPVERFGRSFFSTDSETMARKLLGRRLVRVLDNGARLSGAIVETEAYCGPADLASHAVGGRRTARNESMYAGPGTSYVYFTYGMHFCFNVVCGDKGVPLAVLVRALEPVEGVDEMKRRRAAGRNALALERMKPTDLCSGPGKVCAAMGIDRALDGADLATDARLWIEAGDAAEDVGVGPRIGIGFAKDWVDKPLRFWVKGNAHVSR
jgi:DNA-3-methyladenine glycosylase